MDKQGTMNATGTAVRTTVPTASSSSTRSTLHTAIAKASIDETQVTEPRADGHGDAKWLRVIVTVELTNDNIKFDDNSTTAIVWQVRQGIVSINAHGLLKNCQVAPSKATPPTVSEDANKLTVTYMRPLKDPERLRDTICHFENSILVSPIVTAARLMARIEATFDAALTP